MGPIALASHTAQHPSSTPYPSVQRSQVEGVLDVEAAADQMGTTLRRVATGRLAPWPATVTIGFPTVL